MVERKWEGRDCWISAKSLKQHGDLWPTRAPPLPHSPSWNPAGTSENRSSASCSCFVRESHFHFFVPKRLAKGLSGNTLNKSSLRLGIKPAKMEESAPSRIQKPHICTPFIESPLSIDTVGFVLRYILQNSLQRLHIVHIETESEKCLTLTSLRRHGKHGAQMLLLETMEAAPEQLRLRNNLAVKGLVEP